MYNTAYIFLINIMIANVCLIYLLHLYVLTTQPIITKFCLHFIKILRETTLTPAKPQPKASISTFI